MKLIECDARLDDLTAGVIVGIAVIEKVTPSEPAGGESM
jgi:hypothetical protein